ncbi:MAG: hypothetical protein R2813_09225 [Flavobacteriales bacterium]
MMFLLVFSSCRKDAPESELMDPDKNQISDFYFASNLGGQFELWKAAKEGDEKITSGENEKWWPRVSPNGRLMLFYKSTLSDDFFDFSSSSLWVMNLESREEKEVFATKAHNWLNHGMANWSPNGESIVFCAQIDSTNRWQLFTSDSDGSNLAQLSTRTGYDYLDPVFAIDGKSVFCSIVPNDEFANSVNYELFEIDLESSTETRLTYNDKSDHHAHPSPDGKKLMYETLVDPDYLTIGKWEINELDLVSGRSSSRVQNDNLNLYPRYSSDGEHAYFISVDVFNLRASIERINLQSGLIESVRSDSNDYISIDPF